MVDAAAGEKGLGVGEAGRTGIVHFPPAGETEMMLAAVGAHAGAVFLVEVEDVDAEIGDVLQPAAHGGGLGDADDPARRRSAEQTSDHQSLIRIPYAVTTLKQ